jgi:hypothetical protein
MTGRSSLTPGATDWPNMPSRLRDVNDNVPPCHFRQNFANLSHNGVTQNDQVFVTQLYILTAGSPGARVRVV